MTPVIPPDADLPRCGSVARLLGAHADGQLDAAKTVEVDDHLGRCEACRERVALDLAIRGSLKRGVKASMPEDARARLLTALAGERKREAARAPGPAPAEAPPAEAPAAIDALEDDGAASRRPRMLRHWRTMLPVASAAALTLAWSYAGEQPMALGDATRIGAGFTNDELVNQFVDVHSRPLRPETPDPLEVRGFEREVGVPVHVAQFQNNARFVGGRLLPVQGGERAAMLQYEVVQPNGGGVQRVSVFVYDPRRVQIRSADKLAPRSVGTAQVRVGRARGYSFAVAQHGAVGYAVASDLDVDSSARFAAVADRE